MIVYVWGNLTANNFTPRLDKDTVGQAGQKPGLSAWEVPPVGRKVQGIELDLLELPLKAFPDEPNQGGTPGHVAIAPADTEGEVDLTTLEEWASSRETDDFHPFTQALLKAVVQPNFRSEK